MSTAQIIAEAEAYLELAPANFPRGTDLIRRLLPLARGQAVCERDMECDALCQAAGGEPWTLAEEVRAELRLQHQLDAGARHEFRL